MDIHNEREWQAFKEKHIRRIHKKYWAQGMGSFVLHRRTLNTAFSVITRVADIEFSKLTLTLYMLCKDDKTYKDIALRYQGGVELAKVDPERFVLELDRLYTHMGTYFKKNYAYADYFEFLSFFIDGQMEREPGTDEFDVFSAYMDIILQQVEYLRPNYLDYNEVVAGVKTNGTSLIVVRDPYPGSDVPAYHLEKATFDGKRLSMQDILNLYRQNGIFINHFGEAELVRIASQVVLNDICLMASYINEYTTDILPVRPFAIPERIQDGYDLARNPGEIDETLKRLLRNRRRRTLPANGVTVHFEKSKVCHDMLLKEVLHDDSICLLCRVDTDLGDIMVRFNTRSGIFFSPFITMQSAGAAWHDNLRRLALWAYAAYVCDDARFSRTSYHEMMDDPDAEVYFTAIPGKLRIPGTGESRGARAGSEKYETELTSINGYVRKLPTGQKASEKAVSLAQSLGFDLSPDETYVQPFSRQSWVLKKTEGN